MADMENEQPTKKRRLSLSLRKKKKADTSGRFKQVKDEVEVAAKGVLPENTAKTINGQQTIHEGAKIF